MMVSIDRAGRVVIPKDVRDALSLGPDAQLDMAVEGDELRLTPVRQRGRRIVEVDGWPVIEAAPGRSTSDADVRRWRDDGQR
ncbi:MAG: AbrB/MazE/SpoVT family DNA-binding domain-containing protein [Propionibacteriaceae bacterium]|nr:AbrB/MazE/SpoVT family DNA-binding domain-containing protein [Propionibacteriaceae bacterium]